MYIEICSWNIKSLLVQHNLARPCIQANKLHWPNSNFHRESSQYCWSEVSPPIRMAVTGSLRHIAWLQRFDGHAETNHSLHEHSLCAHSCDLTGWRSLFLWPSLFSFLICAVISSWLLLLHSFLFLEVEALSASSARLSISSELHVRRALRLMRVRLGVFSFAQNTSQTLLSFRDQPLEHQHTHHRPSRRVMRVTGVHFIHLDLRIAHTAAHVWGLRDYLQRLWLRLTTDAFIMKMGKPYASHRFISCNFLQSAGEIRHTVLFWDQAFPLSQRGTADDTDVILGHGKQQHSGLLLKSLFRFKMLFPIGLFPVRFKKNYISALFIWVLAAFLLIQFWHMSYLQLRPKGVRATNLGYF